MPQKKLGCENESDSRKEGVVPSVYDIDKEAGNWEISWRNMLGMSGGNVFSGWILSLQLISNNAKP